MSNSHTPFVNSSIEQFLDVFVQKKKARTASQANTAIKSSNSDSENETSIILSDKNSALADDVMLNKSTNSGHSSQQSKSEEEIYEEEFLKEICKVGQE